MKIRLIKKLIKNGKIDGLNCKKYLSWKINKLSKKAYNLVKVGNLGEKWDNLNADINFYKQKLFRI